MAMYNDTAFWTALERSGMPPKLLKTIEDRLADGINEEMFALAWAQLRSTKVVIVFGSDTPQKEQFCARLMFNYMSVFRKTGKWISPIHVSPLIQEIPGGGVNVVTGIDLLQQSQARHLAQAVREWIEQERAVVLSVTSGDELTKIVGQAMATYFTHVAATVTLAAPDLSFT